MLKFFTEKGKKANIHGTSILQESFHILSLLISITAQEEKGYQPHFTESTLISDKLHAQDHRDNTNRPAV